MGPLTEYLDTLDESTREAFVRVRDLALTEVPDAAEGTSYGIAALMADGKPLIGFAAAKGHLSVYPYSGAVVEAVSGDLEGFSLSKGTIRFTVDHPLPADVVRKIVSLRHAQITAP